MNEKQYAQPTSCYKIKTILYLTSFFIIGCTLGTFYCKTVVNFPCAKTSIEIIHVKYSFYDHFQYRNINKCRNETSKLFLTVAIISSYERLLIYLPSMLNTWMLTTTREIEIIIFIEEKSLETEELIEEFFNRFNSKTNQSVKYCFFVVKLKHVENSYPPQKKSFYAMKFIYTFYRHRTSWLLRLDDNAYVNIEKLVLWLKNIDHNQALYIGQGGLGRRNGTPIHFPRGQVIAKK